MVSSKTKLLAAVLFCAVLLCAVYFNAITTPRDHVIGSVRNEVKCEDLIQKWQSDPSRQGALVSFYHGDREFKPVEKCVHQAAEQGNAKAQYTLAVDYEHKNPEESRKWLLKAAEGGNARAQLDLETFYGLKARTAFVEHIRREDHKEENDYNDEQEKNYKEVYKWLRMQADQGDAYAIRRLSLTYYRGLGDYYSGIGSEPDYKEAIIWFQKISDTDPLAAYKLGEIFFNGYGVEKNETEAVKWWLKAADKYNPRDDLNDSKGMAETMLGKAYHEGLGVEENDAEAVKWWLKASERRTDGSEDVKLMLWRAYLNGMGVEKNEAEAEKWLRLSKGIKGSNYYIIGAHGIEVRPNGEIVVDKKVVVEPGEREEWIKTIKEQSKGSE
jgi:hypothetical protein